MNDKHTSRSKRRNFGVAAVAAALVTTIAGMPAAHASAPAQARDTLKLLWWQAPTILNPHLATGTKDFDASRLVYEPLASYDRNGKLIPALAADIPSRANGGLAADGKSVTWKLKQNVKWSDGTPFTAEDVKFTYEYVTNKETAATTANNFNGVASVEVVNATTIKINFKDVTPVWANAFVGVNGLILPQHIFKDFAGAKSREAPANLLPVGTGPFKVVEFKPGDTVIYEANPAFREKGKPFFKRVELKGGGDAVSAARAVLQTGDFDFAWNLQVEAAILQQLASAGKGQILLNPGGTVEQLFLNQTDPTKEVDGERSSIKNPHPFFTDKLVRQAVSLAIDRKTIVEQLYGPAGTIATNIVPAPPAVASKNIKWEYNLDKAKALLDKAGYKPGADGVREKNGVRLNILLQTSVNPVRQKTQVIIKQSLEQIGFKVELKSVDAGVFFGSDANNPDNINKFYADAQFYSTGSSSPDPAAFLENWTTAKIAQKSNLWSTGNYSRWSNPAYDKLFVQSTTELNAQRRNQLLIELNDLVVNDYVVIPIVARTFPNGASNTIAGINLTPWDSSLWQVKDWTRK